MTEAAVKVSEPTDYIWAPQEGPQALAVICPCRIIMYGGARGGGKTDCMLGRQIIGALRHGYSWAGLVIHRNYKNFKELRRRIRELIRNGLPATLKGGPNQTNYLVFRNGAEVIFTAVPRVEDVEQFLGHQYTEIGIEEGCKFGFILTMIDKLKGCLRSPHGVKCTLFITTNPGGPGHIALRTMFVDPAREGFKLLNLGTGKSKVTAIYIPSRVYDNKILCQKDPEYTAMLESISDENVRRAWLEGDWYVLVGEFFSDIWKPDIHVIPKFEVPRQWTRLFSMDWGSAKPFSVGWYAIADGRKIKGLPFDLKKGAMVRYAEWYGCAKGQSDVGLRLESKDVGRRIVELERARDERTLRWDRVGDPAMFSSEDGPCVAEKLATVGVPIRPGDNKRIPGWDECRYRLRNGLFHVTENCRNFINIIPALPRDEDNWEDLDTDSEDHIADEWRLGCMARPRVAPSEKEIDVKQSFRRFENTVLDPYAGY